MNNPNVTVTPLLIERADEKLRQEREIFNQRRIHDSRWFHLRLIMGYTSVVLLGSVMAVASVILFNNSEYPQSVVTAAGAALFIDVLGMLIGVWKIVLAPTSSGELQPVTEVELPNIVDVIEHNG